MLARPRFFSTARKPASTNHSTRTGSQTNINIKSDIAPALQVYPPVAQIHRAVISTIESEDKSSSKALIPPSIDALKNYNLRDRLKNPITDTSIYHQCFIVYTMHTEEKLYQANTLTDATLFITRDREEHCDRRYEIFMHDSNGHKNKVWSDAPSLDIGLIFRP